MYCRKCDRELPIEAFGTRKTPAGEVIPRLPCKECDSKQKKAYWRSKHPEKEKSPIDPVRELEKEQTKVRIEEKHRLKAEGKKRCTVCGEIKFLAEFHAYSAVCADCWKEKTRKRDGYYEREAQRRQWEANREEHRQRAERWQEKLNADKRHMEAGVKRCPHCGETLPLEAFTFYEKGHRYMSWCRVCVNKAYKTKNRKGYVPPKELARREQERSALYECLQCHVLVPYADFCVQAKKCKSCLARNKEAHIQQKHIQHREWHKRRLQTDGAYRLQCRISKNLHVQLQDDKNGSSEKWTGCTKQFLKGYIASLFTEGMTWENYGEWQLDHIVPQSYFDFRDIEQIRVCWNYRNLQPLWKADNVKKGAILPENFEAVLANIRANL